MPDPGRLYTGISIVHFANAGYRATFKKPLDMRLRAHEPRRPLRMRNLVGVWSCLALMIMFLDFAATVVPVASMPPVGHFADADDHSLVADGKPLYMRYCASCHGRKLQGQPLWQLEGPGGRRRAPAQDDTGHTWQHSDEDIFRMTKSGHFAGTSANTISTMPAFEAVMSDAQILAVMAFIKARWSLGLRASQSMLNPRFAGMPPSVSDKNWTFPPTCMTTRQLWKTEAP